MLRYGGFYGPGHRASPRGGDQYEAVRERKFPVPGDGGGVWSLVHVDDAAAATVAAIERGAPGDLQRRRRRARAGPRVAARARRRRSAASRRGALPRLLARLALGPAGYAMMTESRGALNGKARRELGWTPAHPSWREGFTSLREGV